MMIQAWSRHTGAATIGFGVIGTALYLCMVTGTLAHIEDLSGLRPFDMRPLGYSASQAAALLNALEEEGRAYYLSRQIPLDMAYPAVLALTLISAMCWFGRRLKRPGLVRLGVLLAIGAALCDYAENLGIMALILSWPDSPLLLVHAASTATILKSVFTTLAVIQTIFMGLLTGAFWAWRPDRGV